MMEHSDYITLSAGFTDHDSAAELLGGLRIAEGKGGLAVVSSGGGTLALRKRGPLLPLPEFTIAVGSAGAFATLYRVIRAYLERNRDRELVIETKKGKIIIKGHSMADEQEVLSALGLDFEGSKVDQLKD